MNPFNLTIETQEALYHLSDELLQSQIDITETLPDSAREHAARLKHQQKPQEPLDKEYQFPKRNIEDDMQLLLSCRRLQTLCDIVSGRSVVSSGATVAGTAPTIRELLDFTQNTADHCIENFLAYQEILGPTKPARLELEKIYEQLSPPTQESTLTSRVLKKFEDAKKR